MGKMIRNIRHTSILKEEPIACSNPSLGETVGIIDISR